MLLWVGGRLERNPDLINDWEHTLQKEKLRLTRECHAWPEPSLPPVSISGAVGVCIGVSVPGGVVCVAGGGGKMSVGWCRSGPGASVAAAATAGGGAADHLPR